MDWGLVSVEVRASGFGSARWGVDVVGNKKGLEVSWVWLRWVGSAFAWIVVCGGVVLGYGLR